MSYRREIDAVLESRDAGQLVKAVAASYALPIDMDPIRPADIYAAAPTAITKVLTRQKIAWDPGNSTIDAQLSRTDWGAMIFKDLSRHIVNYSVLGNNPNYAYNWLSDLSTMSKTWNINGGAVVDVNPAGAAATPNELQPHGPILYAGKSGERSGVWLDGGTTANNTDTQLTITFADVTGLAASDVVVTVYRYRAGEWQEITNWVALIGGGTNFMTLNVLESGYYCFTIDTGGLSNTWSTTFTVEASYNNSTTWAHLAANNLFNNLCNIDKFRCFGLGVLYQNEASELNSQGNILGVQMSGNTDWYDGLAAGPVGGASPGNTNFYNTVFQLRAANSKLLKNGIYGFRKPQGDYELEFRNEIRKVGLNAYYNNGDPGALPSGVSTTATAFFNLDDPSDYLVLAASAKIAGAGDGILVVGMGVEYSTENAWIGVEPAATPKALFDQGIAVLKDVPQWHENPVHWDEILDSISNAATSIAPALRLIPTVGPVLSTVAGVGGAAAYGLRRWLYPRGDEVMADMGEDNQGNPKLEGAKQVITRPAQVQIPIEQMNEAERSLVTYRNGEAYTVKRRRR